jgi:hypothetical protein
MCVYSSFIFLGVGEKRVDNWSSSYIIGGQEGREKERAELCSFKYVLTTFPKPNRADHGSPLLALLMSPSSMWLGLLWALVVDGISLAEIVERVDQLKSGVYFFFFCLSGLDPQLVEVGMGRSGIGFEIEITYKLMDDQGPRTGQDHKRTLSFPQLAHTHTLSNSWLARWSLKPNTRSTRKV